MFITQLIIGILLISLTVIIHAVALDYLMNFIEKISPKTFKYSPRMWQPLMLVIAVMGCFFTLVFEIWLWAVLYMGVGVAELSTFESALYFSTTTFTTVGYGDVYLGTDWRLLSSFQSANGFILFGWTTAFMFEVTSKLYKNDQIRKTEKNDIQH